MLVSRLRVCSVLPFSGVAVVRSASSPDLVSRSLPLMHCLGCYKVIAFHPFALNLIMWSPWCVAHALRMAPPYCLQRPTKLTISASDLKGKTFNLTLTGIKARVFQHEYDHLEVCDCFESVDHLGLYKLGFSAQSLGAVGLAAAPLSKCVLCVCSF